MQIDKYGNDVGYNKRLEDIKNRYRETSEVYKKCVKLVENIKNKKFDVITSRAVADLSKICEYALPLLKAGGYFAAYKSRKAQEEIRNAIKVLAKYNAKIDEIITYTLPLDEVFERNLIIISKQP